MKLNKLIIATSAMMIGAVSAVQAETSSPAGPAASGHLIQPLEQRHIHNHDHHGTPENQLINAPKPQKRMESKTLSLSNNTLSKHSEAKFELKATATCDVNAFNTSNSNTLISEIKNQGTTCVNELFSASSSTQAGAFSSNNMIAVSNHTNSLSQSYAGGGDDDLTALFLFIRAGYYAEFYNDQITFTSSVTPAAKGAIDAFVNNSHFYDDNDNHGKTLGEVIIAMDSTEQQDVYLPIVKQWLTRWNQSYAGKWYMRNAVNGIFTILFRGQWNANFEANIQNDTALVTALRDFALSDWMIDGDAEFMIANAGRELGRLKTYAGAPIQNNVDSALNSVFNKYEMYGFGDAVWLGAADTATYHGDCADYNICGFETQIEAAVLSQAHECSSTIRIRAQNMTATQFSSACSKMGYEENYFHNKLTTNNQPVADDNNTQLQVNIFDSSDDYGKYAGIIFGISTNNGGMYLEGDPSAAGNVPNFVAYEASYANPDHFVWNLEHEYVHYLDGRFDLYGDFNAPTEAIVWWSEGVAEYVSKENNNQAAIDTILDGSVYSLGAIFETTYDGFDQDRIYRWGYLAVRFMFEKHPNEVYQMLASTRTGNWNAYKSRINTWAANYSNEFTQWTQDLANNGGGNQAPVANANGPYSGTTTSAIAFSSAGSVDNDGTIDTYSWDFGDGQNSSSANPNHQYSAEGTYTATLTVTDNEGVSSAATASVTINNGGGDTPTPISSGVPKSNLSGASADFDHYYIDVPANATALNVSISGGSGDADLYVRQGALATEADFDCRPYVGGNSESCNFDNPAQGRWYIAIRGYSAYSGVTLTADVTASANVPPQAAINSPSSAEVGESISFDGTGSFDSDGTVANYSWNFGDGNTATGANATHSYASAGNYTVTLTVTDDDNATDTTTASVTISDTSPPGSDLVNGDWLAIDGAQSSETTYTLNVPTGAETLSFYLNGGSGDADLYVKFGSAPTTSDYDCRPYKSGNDETCDITNIQAGTYYVMVRGYQAYNTFLMGKYTLGSSNMPNACATQSPITSGQLQDGTVECLGNTDTIWLSVGGVNAHNNIAITSGNGTGDLTIEYTNGNWPSNGNIDATSNNSGNSECIYLNNQTNYWGYLKITGATEGASIVVDFDTPGCR